MASSLNEIDEAVPGGLAHEGKDCLGGEKKKGNPKPPESMSSPGSSNLDDVAAYMAVSLPQVYPLVQPTDGLRKASEWFAHRSISSTRFARVASLAMPGCHLTRAAPAASKADSGRAAGSGLHPENSPNAAAPTGGAR